MPVARARRPLLPRLLLAAPKKVAGPVEAAVLARPRLALFTGESEGRGYAMVVAVTRRDMKICCGRAPGSISLY